MSSLSARSLKRFSLVHFVCDSHFLCVCASQTSYSNIGSTPNLRDHIVCVLGCCRCKTQLEVTSDCWRICIYTSGRSHPWNVSADNGTALICKAGRRVTRRPACRKISTSEMIWLSICSYFVATSASTSRDCNKVAGIFLLKLFSWSILSWTKKYHVPLCVRNTRVGPFLAYVGICHWMSWIPFMTSPKCYLLSSH